MMNQPSLESLIQEIVTKILRQDTGESIPSPSTFYGETLAIPVGVSARHVHLSNEHIMQLFGEGAALTPRHPLSQPGQFAAEETVLLAGPKGSIDNVRILGPSRAFSQVEAAFTDAVKLGLSPPVRDSGAIAKSSPITLIGPNGTLTLKEGFIVARRHIHMTPEDALRFGVVDQQVVKIRTNGLRSTMFENVLIRVDRSSKLELHIDTDEANAAGVRTGDSVQLVGSEGSKVSEKPIDRPSLFTNNVLTVRDVQGLLPYSTLFLSRKTIITPLAHDEARSKKIRIVREEE